MHNFKRLITLFITLSLFIFSSKPVLAAEDFSFNNAYIPEMPPMMKMLAGYVTLSNNGEQDIIIDKACSKAFDSVEMHESKIVDSLAKMVQLKALRIPAKSSVTLKPGGIHLMLINPGKRPIAGDTIDVMLVDQAGQAYDITFTVKKLSGETHHHHHHH